MVVVMGKWMSRPGGVLLVVQAAQNVPRTAPQQRSRKGPPMNGRCWL
jgi:hypothetical protein